MRVARTSEALPFASPTFPAEAASARSQEVAGAPTCADERARAGSGAHPFLHMLCGLGQELDRGESIAETAIHGGAQAGMSPQRLIALQAGIYRYSEAVDLVTKLVDRGTQAVRTTLQNQ